MSEIKRRDFLKGTATFAAGVTAALTAAGRAEAGDPSFMNNVPDPLLTGKQLPTFKFALEKSKGRVAGASTAKEGQRLATADLQGDRRGVHGARAGGHAGVALARHRSRVGVRGPRASPDDSPRSRGLHRERTTSSRETCGISPRGHGHMLECLGKEPCHFVLMFDNGYFSEFGTFSITDWIGHTPETAPGEELRHPPGGLRRVPGARGVLRARGGTAPAGGRPA